MVVRVYNSRTESKLVRNCIVFWVFLNDVIVYTNIHKNANFSLSIVKSDKYFSVWNIFIEISEDITRIETSVLSILWWEISYFRPVHPCEKVIWFFDTNYLSFIFCSLL